MLRVGVILSDADWIRGGNQRGRGRKLQLFRLRREVRHEDRWVGRSDKWRVVVLARGEHVQAYFFGLLGDGYGGLDALVLRGGFTGNWVGGDISDCENSYLHGSSITQVR